MARTKGPSKGLVTFVCEESAISSTYIVEPLLLTAAEFAVMEAGGSFTGSLGSDTATQTKYVTLANGSVDSVTIEDVYVGLGTGAQTVFSKTLTGTPVRFTGFTVTAGAVTGTANASTGVITGAGITSGSVTAQGAFTVTFTAAPAANVPVLIDYVRGV